ncbi:hypothetical protein [Cerasicoccus arenae]|uniref:Lipoprotein n=1 Tax=Cerasicoccus arenae TaxID=424488 RepID=A0A8J3GDM7_9BACT|nr:hypothetical protein [Cerasicoccus arenae]MBK1858165.1 hypothetical protein [Cerasicoccus arenae]GHB96890.1 hypothetical protein GCM10007047_11070 [Cerasicoccus arenae]
MKYIALSILIALALAGCTSDQTPAQEKQQGKANAAMGAGATSLEASGVVDSEGGTSLLNPPKSDFSIDL